MSSYRKATELIAKHPELADFVGPRSGSLIAAAERKLGIQFPLTYRRFLTEFGAGGFGSEEILGVIDEDFEASSTPDAIWWTLQDRRNWNLPHHLVAVYDVGDGEVFYLDLSTPEKSEAPVIAYDAAYTPEEQSGEVIANDFGEFLLQLVQRQVNWKEGRVPEL
jgi:antitoxin YobK